MIEIHTEKIKDTPVLHVMKEGAYYNKLPLVFFIHGFTSAKEHNLHFAYLLAQKGFRVILPDAHLHGERGDGRHSEKLVYEFWNVVLQNIRELEMIKKELQEQELVNDRIGVVGTSMGGITVFGALTQYEWIQTGVSLMGSPSYVKFAKDQIASLRNAEMTIPFSNEELEAIFQRLEKYDLSRKPESLAGRPLLIWHGKQDSVVPFQPTCDFYEEIKSDYTRHPERLRFIADEHAGHKVTREALLETVEWFVKYLL